MTDDIDDWTPPGSDGYATCRLHPGERFVPHEGCAPCIASPPTFAREPSDLEIAADKVLADCAVVEADERGLADMLLLEKRVELACRDARRDAAVCRRLAREHEARARDILAGTIASAEPERDAVKWFGEAVKLRALAAKSVDTQAKAIKIQLPAAIERWAAKRLADRARLIGSRGSH